VNLLYEQLSVDKNLAENNEQKKIYRIVKRISKETLRSWADFIIKYYVKEKYVNKLISNNLIYRVRKMIGN